MLATNADPYANFKTGSLVHINMASVDVDADRNFMDELEVFALPLDPYSGGIGIAANRATPIAVVPNRWSPEAGGRSNNDRAYVVDLTEMAAPELWEEQETVTLRDDPFPVAVSETQQRMFIGNLSDHSVSVVRTRQNETEDLFGVVDVVPERTVEPAEFEDADASGSRASLARLSVDDPELVPNDLWTLAYRDHSFELIGMDDDALGRWTGSPVTLDRRAIDVEILDLFGASVVGPQGLFMATSGADGLMFWSDGQQISRGLRYGDATTYLQDAILVEAQDDWIGSPTPLAVDGSPAVAYERRTSEDDVGGDIELAIAAEGATYLRLEQPLLSAVELGWVALRDPYIIADDTSRGYRMWLSVWDGVRWSIGLSESLDGLAWSSPTVVITSDTADIYAPAVVYVSGRYELYAMQEDGERPVLTRYASHDGLAWGEGAELLEPSVDPKKASVPPGRFALAAATASSWAVESRDRGRMEGNLSTGTELDLEGAGLRIRVAQGHRVPDDLPDVQDRRGMHVTTHLVIGSTERFYVTTLDASARERIAVLSLTDSVWRVETSDAIPNGEGGNRRGAGAPVVVESAVGFTMFYEARKSDGTSAIRRATSTDGLTGWTPVAGDVLENVPSWAVGGQRPHSAEATSEGLRLWYVGNDGSRTRIGVALEPSGDAAGAFQPESGVDNAYQLGTGLPGSFDDSAVDSPLVFTVEGTRHLYYSGFDGEVWRVGHAVEADDGRWEPWVDDDTERSIPAMQGTRRSFSAGGVRSATLSGEREGDALWYSGWDGDRWRLGLATNGLGQEGRQPTLAAALYEQQALPTVGDQFSFRTYRSDTTSSVIELRQFLDDFVTLGEGMSSMRLDEDRGFLFITSKLVNRIWVLDVRDDSTDTFEDSNVLDLEAVIELDGLSGGYGFRDLVISPQRGLAYVSTNEPDGLVVLDLSLVVDDATKDVVEGAAIGSIALPDADRDRGTNTSADVGAAGLALSADENLLLATHFRDNSVVAVDLTLGPYGEVIRRVDALGENPHVVRFAPDGTYAAVGLYSGDVVDNVASSTIALINTEPDSPEYLEVITWLANR
jgi:DNA-binding beta-propeller fold protein YncE